MEGAKLEFKIWTDHKNLQYFMTSQKLMQEEDLKERIRKAQEGDEKIVKAVEELKKAGIKTLRDKEWEVEDGIVMRKEGYTYQKGTSEGKYYNCTTTPW